MTTHTLAPPRIAEWLVSLVATPEQTATILGDLLEEFSSILSRSGAASARRWYWRQSALTIAHLVKDQVRRAPLDTAAIAIGGFLLYVFAERTIHTAAKLLVTRSQVYSFIDGVTFWRMLEAAERYVVPVAIAWTVARIARGREVMAVLGVAVAGTACLLVVYASWLLATSGQAPADGALGLALRYVPGYSVASMFLPTAGPPRAPSVIHTMWLVSFTFIGWWIPTILVMLTAATVSRTSASWRILTRGAV